MAAAQHHSAIPYFCYRHRDGSTTFIAIEEEGQDDLFLTTAEWTGDDKPFVTISGKKFLVTSLQPPELQDNTEPAHHTTDEVNEIEEVERRTITYHQ